MKTNNPLPNRQSLARWFPGLLTVSMIGCLLSSGCGKKEAPGPDTPKPPSPTNSLNAANSADELQATNLLEKKVTRLLESFQPAEESTRARIESAVESVRAGKARDAIVQLKMVDADTDLNADQVQSIKNLILEIREK